MSKTVREVTWLGQATAQADDQALTRVVRMLDGLAHRGEADAVLAMARHRLRALRPPRPLGFTRLLFLPLDGAIVASARWRRGAGQVPRSAVAPLTGLVHRQLGSVADELAAECEGGTTEDAPRVAAIGTRLWPLAAQALTAAPPEEWGATGLVAADYAAIADLCRPLWQHGPLLWEAMAQAADGPPEPPARAALAALLPAGPAPLAVALATLTLRASQPGRLAALAAQLDPQCRAQAQQALDRVLDEPLPQLDLLDLANAAAAGASLAARLQDMEGCGLIHGERQQRLAMLRRAADEACRERFLAGAEAQLVTPAGHLLAAPQVTDAEATALETDARQLRVLQEVGRRLGGAAGYDKALAALQEALTRLAPLAGGAGAAGLRRMDLARLVEILCGPEAAAQVLAAGS